MKAALLDHFTRQFQTLESLFAKVNDAAWNYGDQRLKGVWRWMLHTLETIEFYLGEQKPDAFPWGARFGVDWEAAEPARIPTQNEMQAYLDDVKNHALTLLQAKPEEAFTAPETVQPWTGATYAAKLLYLMRHTQQHVGDMNRVLAMCGCPALDWH